MTWPPCDAPASPPASALSPAAAQPAQWPRFNDVVLLDDSPARSPSARAEAGASASARSAADDVILLDTPPGASAPPAPSAPSAPAPLPAQSHAFPETILIEDSPRKRRRRDAAASPQEDTSPVIVVDDDDDRRTRFAHGHAPVAQPSRTRPHTPPRTLSPTTSTARLRAHRRRLAPRTPPAVAAAAASSAAAAARNRLRSFASAVVHLADDLSAAPSAAPAARTGYTRTSMPPIPPQRPPHAIRTYAFSPDSDLSPVDLPAQRTSPSPSNTRHHPRRVSHSSIPIDLFPTLDLFAHNNTFVQESPPRASASAHPRPARPHSRTPPILSARDPPDPSHSPLLHHPTYPATQQPSASRANLHSDHSSPSIISPSPPGAPGPSSASASSRAPFRYSARSSAAYRRQNEAQNIALQAIHRSTIRARRDYGTSARASPRNGRHPAVSAAHDPSHRHAAASSSRTPSSANARLISESLATGIYLRARESSRLRRRAANGFESLAPFELEVMREGASSDQPGRARRTSEILLSRDGRRYRGSSSFMTSQHAIPVFAVFQSQVELAFQGDRLDYENLIRLDEQLMRDKNRAEKAQIDALPVQKATAEDKEIRCCVCMCDVEEGEELRVLPCSHKYHRKCIDEWLTYNGCCPVDKKRISTERSRRRCPVHSG